MQRLFRDRSGRAKDSSGMTRSTAKMTFIAAADGKQTENITHISNIHFPPKRVAQMQKRNGCALWMHISSGKRKQESRQNDGGVRASTGKLETCTGKRATDSARKVQRQISPPTAGSACENHSVLLYCMISGWLSVWPWWESSSRWLEGCSNCGNGQCIRCGRHVQLPVRGWCKSRVGSAHL